MKQSAAIALLAGLLTSTSVSGRELEGAKFAESLSIGGSQFSLNGAGVLRVALVFKVYAAALYLGEGVKPESVFDDVPKRIEIGYLRRVSTNIIFEAGDAALARNVPAETLASLRPRLDQINALYRDVDKGDRFAITYLPGKGSELELNGKSLGTIDGADFASAYFKIWLGAHVSKPELRDALLNRKK